MQHGETLKKDPSKWIDSSVWHGKAHTWEKLPWLISQWKRSASHSILPYPSLSLINAFVIIVSSGRPFVLKGVQSIGDAQKALQYGCDGVVVTNHAGRQVDGAVGSLEVLPEIVDAVGDKMTVLFDSGVRSGADVFKALALGAKAVMVGRLYVWGEWF